MNVSRIVAAVIAALVAALGFAPAAAAAPSRVAAPPCADSPIEVTWGTHFQGGRYELASVTLTGLESCAGADLTVAIGSEDEVLAEVEVTVPETALILDVQEHRIPARWVEAISITLSATIPVEPDPTPDATPEPDVTPPDTTPGTDASPDTDATPDAGVTTPGGPLPSTGANAGWLALVAAMFIFLGALLRRRSRDHKENHHG